MIIAGLQNLSLVDFPGHLAAVVFLQGCNFNCGYCHNPDLITTKKRFDVSEKEIFDYLVLRKNMIEGVVVSGGEPTIHKNLPSFIQQIKDIGMKVKLDTNGSNPKQLEELLHSTLLDFVSVDIKTSFQKYFLVTKQKNIKKTIEDCIRLVVNSGIPYEFRTTCMRGIVDEEDFRMIGRAVKGAEKYCLQQFRPVNTYDKVCEKIVPYTKEELERFQTILKEFVEKVEIRGI